MTKRAITHAHELKKISNSYVVTYALPSKEELITFLSQHDGSRHDLMESYFISYKPSIDVPYIRLPAEENFGKDKLIYQSCGFSVFNQNFYEMVKNSISAGATLFECEFFYTQSINKVTIVIRDNQPAIRNENNEEVTRLQQHKFFGPKLKHNNVIDFSEFYNESKIPQTESLRRTSISTNDISDSNVIEISGAGKALNILTTSLMKENRGCELYLTSDNQDYERATFTIISPNAPLKRVIENKHETYSHNNEEANLSINTTLHINKLLISPSSDNKINTPDSNNPLSANSITPESISNSLSIASSTDTPESGETTNSASENQSPQSPQSDPEIRHLKIN